MPRTALALTEGTRSGAIAPEVLVAAMLMLARWASGLPPPIQIPYWYLSYSEGFIRRALLGTLTMPWLVGLSLHQAVIAIAAIGTIISFLLIATLTALFRASRLPLLDPVPLLFVASGALAWLATDLSVLDGAVELFSLWAFALLYRGNLAGAALCAVVPLTHEGGLFLLLPLLGGLWLLRPEARRAVFAGGIAAAAATAALWFGATNRFAWPAGMPAVDPGYLADFVRWQLGQAPQVFGLLHWRPLPSVVFSVLPALAIAAEVGRRAGWRRGSIVLAGVLFTWTTVAIALDTERLLAWGPLTAIVLAGLALREPYGRARHATGAPS